MSPAASPPRPEPILAQIIQDFVQFMHQTGLSRPQIHALLYIHHAGECQISEISDLAESSPAAATQLVKRMVRRGLVERTEDPSDRRVKKLRLTEKSLKLIRQGVSSNRFLTELMAELTPQQRKTVHTAFGYLAEASQRIKTSHKRRVKHHVSNRA